MGGVNIWKDFYFLNPGLYTSAGDMMSQRRSITYQPEYEFTSTRSFWPTISVATVDQGRF